MKRTSNIRPMLAGLSLVLASGIAFAQNASTSHHDTSTKPHASQEAHGKRAPDQRHGQHKQRGPMMKLPAEVLAQLNLSDAQKAKYEEAQTQTQAMKQAWRDDMKQQRAALQKQGDRKFDPKQMFERQNQYFEKKQAMRQSIQKQWLGVWDSLNDAQKEVIQKHMQARAEQRRAKTAKQG